MRISDWSSDVCSSDLGDTRIAGAIVDALTGLTDVPGGGKFALEREVTNFIGSTALEAARNQEAHADAVARHGDIMNRREAVSGVNIDEELAQLILFQNSYGAAARLITDRKSTRLNSSH